MKAVAVAVAAVAVVAVVAAATVASGGSAVPVIVGAAVGAASSGAVDAAIQYKNTGKWYMSNDYSCLRGCGNRRRRRIQEQGG